MRVFVRMENIDMVPRILEPEVMDGDHDAVEYDNMNHQHVNSAFADDFLSIPNFGADCLDLGTGTALIPIEICQRNETVRFLALDASIPMLELARYRLDLAGVSDRVQLVHGDVKQLSFEESFFDAVISNSLVHHLPNPSEMLVEAWRVLRPSGWLFIRDLYRPSTIEEIERLVTEHARGESDFSQQMLRQSFHAALSLGEIKALLTSIDIDPSSVAMTSDRHWTIRAQKPS
jgi:ubiquinone/menaquinone biosynthesis C-methylase UbiE